MRKTLIAAALTLVAAPALAAHCPMDAKVIDDALTRSSLSAEQKAGVQALRDEGMALHTAGDHRASEAKLAEAMRTLLGAQLN